MQPIYALLIQNLLYTPACDDHFTLYTRGSVWIALHFSYQSEHFIQDFAIIFSFSACECVFFDGFGYLSNGTFMSPNFPERYEPDTHCVLYTFVGRQGELIALTFTYLQLEPPDEAGKYVCASV